MINVEIYITALNRSYDSQVEESVSIESLILEISDMIGTQMKSAKLERQKFMLCSLEQNKILDKNRSLAYYNIRNGARLMLV